MTETATTRTGACLGCQAPLEQTFDVLWLPKYCSEACSERVEADARRRTQYFNEAAIAHHRRNLLAESGVRTDISEGRLTLDSLPDLYDETRIVGGVERSRYREVATIVKDFVRIPPLCRSVDIASILYLYGDPGTGKTWLLEAAIGYAVRELQLSATFTTPMNIWSSIKSAGRDDSEKSEARLLQDLTGVGLLGLDDLGRKVSPTEWEVMILLQVIDDRARRNAPTIINCNYSAKELFELWSDRDDDRKTKNVRLLCDRLAEAKRVISIPMNGKSLRRGK